MIVNLLALVAVLAAIGLIAGYTLRFGNPPTPTSPKVRRAILSTLPPLNEGNVYELGAGWGNLALALAAQDPDRPVIAVEASPLPWLVARIWSAVSRKRNISVLRRNFMEIGLSDAALIVCYLEGRTMATLAPKLAQELANGAFVVAHTFEIRGWTAQATATAPDIYNTPIYVYRIPESLPDQSQKAPTD